MKTKVAEGKVEQIFKVLLWLIIALGIALRVIVYLQNRDLIIDEANIARNLNERGFWALAKPLSYEQYAPPVFLWIEKMFTSLFGLGELSLKIYPLLTGIAALLVLRSVLLKLMPASAAWFPLILMASTYWYILYSTAVKQYMPDAMITLILVWLALQYDILKTSKGKFIGIWLAAGIIAVWSSMPSVFVLTGIGAYYAWQCLQHKDGKRFTWLVVISVVWLVNFAAYYVLILKSQVGSKYLQDYHLNYFLIATPENRQEWGHNWFRIKEIINNLGGYENKRFYVICALCLTGLTTLLWKRKDLLLLIFLPVLLTLLAAALKQFSLIERVILFMMPLLLILLGYGFYQLVKLPSVVFNVLGVVVGIFILIGYNEYKFFHEKLPSPEIGKALDFLNKSKATGQQLFIHESTKPVYIYYTQIAPRKPEWTHLTGGRLLEWDDYYNSVLRGYNKGRAYFVYTGGMNDHDMAVREAELSKCVLPVDSFKGFISIVKVYDGNTCME